MGSLNDHLKHCDFVQVPCSNQGCARSVERRHLTGHSQDECEHRLLPCPHCKIGIAAISLEQHIEGCGHRPIKCTNHCGIDLVQADLHKHLQEHCILRLVACPLNGLGGRRE